MLLGKRHEEDGKLYLVYTGVRYEVVNPEDPHTCQDEQFESAQLMISSEDGFHFDNENGKEVIIPPVTDPAVGDRTHERSEDLGEERMPGISSRKHGGRQIWRSPVLPERGSAYMDIRQ